MDQVTNEIGYWQISTPFWCKVSFYITIMDNFITQSNVAQTTATHAASYNHGKISLIQVWHVLTFCVFLCCSSIQF